MNIDTISVVESPSFVKSLEFVVGVDKEIKAYHINDPTASSPIISREIINVQFDGSYTGIISDLVKFNEDDPLKIDF